MLLSTKHVVSISILVQVAFVCFVGVKLKVAAPAPAAYSASKNLSNTALVDRLVGGVLSSLLKSKQSPTDTCIYNEASYPAKLNRPNVWYLVDPGHSAYMFSSAYHEANSENVIRIIGATLTKGQKKHYYCLFWYSTDNGTIEAKRAMFSVATADTLPDGHRLKYSAAIFTCPLPSNHTPASVSLVSERCGKPRNVAKVTRLSPQIYQKDFTVCLSPLHFSYDDVYEVIGWLEFNMILGAEKFIMYDFSLSPVIKGIIQSYAKSGVVEIVPWHLPKGMSTHKEIHYFGQVAAINECLLRIKNYSKYMVTLDLDEFIIPYQSDVFTWPEMLERLSPHNSYQFNHVFFRRDWVYYNDNSPTGHEAKQLNIIPLLKTQHESTIWPEHQRSKYICRTDAVRMLSVHHAILLKDKGSGLQVQPRDALLHHYRYIKVMYDTEPRLQNDMVVTKYGQQLVRNVALAWEHMHMKGKHYKVKRVWSEPAIMKPK